MLKRMSEYSYYAGACLRLYPSHRQKRLIKKNADAARFVYNEMVACSKEISSFGSLNIYIRGISERIACLQERMKSVTALKAHFLWMDDPELDANMIANAKKNYAHAWHCYRQGETTSPPAFHRRTYGQTYQTNPHYHPKRVLRAELTNGSAGFRDKHHVYIPKLRLMRCKGSRKWMDKLFDMKAVRIGTMTIRRDACGDYFLSMQLASDQPFFDVLSHKENSLGIDLNLCNFYTDSNGETVEMPVRQHLLERLKRARRILSRKAVSCRKKKIMLKNGRNYQKQRQRVACLERQIKRQRMDFLHIQSWHLIKNHGVIVAEKLDVRHLLHVSRSRRVIQQAGWQSFLKLLAMKADNYGRIFLQVEPAYTTQRCSSCGHILPLRKRLKLSQRIWTCPVCHVSHQRDHNAAQNILQRGQMLFRV